MTEIKEIIGKLLEAETHRLKFSDLPDDTRKVVSDIITSWFEVGITRGIHAHANNIRADIEEATDVDLIGRAALIRYLTNKIVEFVRYDLIGEYTDSLDDRDS